ncbi:uncharacterized protein Pyn_02132 [Prunus yedoensis var. nudiflora]|uniref:Uncharacterized protein n=1 Tax=Prunus yedoensis var. nudiflora TaxID=2094558 RepID=A0A314YXP8_PRUYE|nr:uncharacterized protein Pyn_02132 [Prunus yedoensis var. nudiflora]
MVKKEREGEKVPELAVVFGFGVKVGGCGAIALWLETHDIRATVAKAVLARAVCEGENTNSVFSYPEQLVGKVRTFSAFSGSLPALLPRRSRLSLI